MASLRNARPRGRDRGEQQTGDHRGGMPRLGQVNLKQQVRPGIAHVWFEAGRTAGVAGQLPGRGVRRVCARGHGAPRDTGAMQYDPTIYLGSAAGRGAPSGVR
jgi:hypothetical protein